jgi:hypothetical protein
VTFQPPETGEIDALVTDGYLDSLLAARERRALDSPSVVELDPDVRLAAARLAETAARVHPSFRFEERLAARLADVAARMTLAPAVGAEDASGAPIAAIELALDPAGSALGPVDPLDLLDPARPEEIAGIPRPLIIGGTLASAALSIAGAALVAWRLNRPGRGGTERVRLA